MKYFKNLLTKNIIIFILLGFNINSFSQLHIKNGVEVNKSDCNDLTKLIIMLPYAQTNQYQTVTNINTHSGDLLDIPETDDKYLRYTLSESDIQNYGNTFNIFYEFDITLNSIDFDFDQITEIYPYNTSSNIYTWYTGASGDYVVPTNSSIQTIGDNLWSQSSDIVDYAERCYVYVAENYDYLNPYTGLHTLEDIISAGGGDCGNLSSIYVSLLRYKDIPSRHIVTVRSDGSYHVWADFYLENYGWIPVDVTYKQSNSSGNYFGKYDGNGIVFNKEVWLYLERENGSNYFAALLQNFHYWYWNGSSCNSLNVEHVVNSTQITSIKEVNNEKFMIFPNPANNKIKISNSVSLNNSSIEIYSITGTLISKPCLNNKNEIDISNLSKGIYIIKINSEKYNIVKKIVKE